MTSRAMPTVSVPFVSYRGSTDPPSVRMLATPLRRCAATLLPLPRAVMFKMVSQRIQQSEDPALDISVPIEEPKVVNLVVKRRSRRYVLKEAKKTKEKALVRAQRLLQHKVVTSITPKSRDHFTGQLAHVKEQLVESRKPRRGILMPVGLTRKSLSQSRGIGQGRGVWITFDVTFAFKSTRFGPRRIGGEGPRGSSTTFAKGHFGSFIV
jgi:hypothetical protein